MRRSSAREYTEAMRERYAGASRQERSQLPDEFTRVTGYHRRSAGWLLSGAKPAASGRRRGRPPVYGSELRDALAVV